MIRSVLLIVGTLVLVDLFFLKISTPEMDYGSWIDYDKLTEFFIRDK